ncbi:hypothetical protein K488DRAFT_64527 [Vararia minispora EC-137]|uniref:Uncharacterized protein n=1 Tax=Vararia minispora EC-137 TaxID=1314806 RepID=A0ACB8Q5A6_9AGAM|nr:hypothetical protein K488DRAFT_64527 [Vararia minispora EC-137]
MPRLRVAAGTSLDDLHPITVNSGTPHHLASDLFEGSILAYIKDFPGPDGRPLESEYFEREDRKGVTWSIQVQGRFLRPVSADNVMFGNTFDRPLQLPWGVGAAFRFMKYIDPTLEHDLTSRTKPWALSPLVSTMPYFAHARFEDGTEPPTFPPRSSLDDDLSQLHLAVQTPSRSPMSSPASSRSGSSESVASMSSRATSFGSQEDKEMGSSRKMLSKLSAGTKNDLKHIRDARQRRSFFATQEHRRNVVFGPSDLITTDFCYGFIQFAPSPSLQLPGGISFDLMRYWDGQPVRFMCCERKGSAADDGDEDVPWGRVSWCIVIELVED